jgi:mycothiol synthase
VDIQLRGISVADTPAWAAMLAAAEEVDRTGEHYSEEDLVEELANPDIDPSRDAVGAFRGAEMLAYFVVYPRSNVVGEGRRIDVEGCTRPDVRGTGLGTRMAAAMKQRALAAHAERSAEIPALVTSRGLSDNEPQRDLLAAIGLHPDRWSFLMRAPLDQAVDSRPLPDGLELRRYDASLDSAMQAAHNAAFADYPHFSPWTAGMWRQWVSESRSFRPELSFLVLDPGADEPVVAYVQTNEFVAHAAVTGRREAYVAKVGTRPGYRGRGLASALLRHCLQTYRDCGYDEAALDVDSANPTGALGLYERAGFVTETRWTDYALHVPAA